MKNFTSITYTLTFVAMCILIFQGIVVAQGRYGYIFNNNGSDYIPIVDLDNRAMAGEMVSTASFYRGTLSQRGTQLWAIFGRFLVFNTATRTVDYQSPVLSNPSKPVFSLDGSRVYMLVGSGPMVLMSFDTSATHSVIDSLPIIGSSPLTAFSPVLSRDGKKLYVTDVAQKLLEVNLADGKILRSVFLGENIQQLVTGADDTTLYLMAYPQIDVFDLRRFTVARSLPTPGTYSRGMALSRDGGKLYVVDYNLSKLRVFSLPAGGYTDLLLPPISSIANVTFGPSDSLLYITSYYPHKVNVYNIRTGSIISAIPVSEYPSMIAMPMPIDTTPPAPVSGLHISALSYNSIRLTMTSPGDDDPSGQASFYLIRYAAVPVTEENFGSAMRVSPAPHASSPGLEDTVDVYAGLLPGVKYYFGVKTGDEALNLSALVTDSVLLPPNLIIASVRNTWNMLSVPAMVADYRKSVLFPTSVTNAFAYKGGYVPKDTLVLGEGYWLKFDSAQTVPVAGHYLTSDTIDVSEGWDMIGSLSAPIAAAQISSDPAGIVTTQFFGYNGNYITCDSIQPGKAYWVKVNQRGKLILAMVPGASGRIRIVPTEELPPPPPDGIETATVIPRTYALAQNYPNPFNPSTTLRYTLPAESRVTLRIMNLIGQEVARLVDGIEPAGNRAVIWNASNVASGIYFCRIDAASTVDRSKSFSHVTKMMCIK